MGQKLFFKNSKNQKIAAIIDKPKGSGPFPAVILCHGFKGYKEQMHLLSLARVLAKNGIIAFRFDFGNGVGKSYGKMEDINFKQYLDDLKAAVDYVCKLKIVDKKRIGLAGHSLGGQLVMHYAPNDKRIKVLADLAGVINRKADFSRIWRYQQAKKLGYYLVRSRSKRRSFKIRVKYLEDLMKHDTPSQIKKIKIPTLIVHGKIDESVPIKHSRFAYKLLSGPKKLALIPGVVHTWRKPRDYKIINPLVVDWFKKYL